MPTPQECVQTTAWPMELILEATDQGIYVLDGDGHCTLFNRAAAIMTGWSVRESLGRSIHDLIHHTRPGGAPHPIEECPALSVLRTGRNVHRYSEVYWRRDGTSFPAEYSSSPIMKNGRIMGAVVIFSDITERREVEQSLRYHEETQSTYRATLNILEDFDEERLHVRHIQKATLNLLEDMDADRERMRQTQRATVNILEDFDEEKGKLHNLQLATMNLLEDFDEERRNYQMIQKATLNLLEDMSAERKKSEQTQRALINILDDVEVERIKAEQAKAQLESVNKELEAFSYSVSHDLRAPLRAISGFSEALLEDWSPALDEEGKRYLGLVQENAHKMGQLIDDLLSFSRLGRQTMNVTEFDMAELAQSVFEELRAQVTDRRIDFAMEGPIPPAHGDRALIRQVLVNLLANAIKFTRARESAAITFGCRPGSDQDEYYVSDNGVGFEMQYAGKLFGVFQRLHAVTEFEGTGVGLALVYRIITRHDGTVQARGQVDQGATFSFSLPKRGTI